MVTTLKLFIINCWNGNEKLWKAFWALGVIASALPIVFVLFLKSNEAITIFMLIFELPVIVVWLVSTWRCAFKSSHFLIAIVARIFVVLMVLRYLNSAIKILL
jgi:hypothetical protein